MRLDPFGLCAVQPFTLPVEAGIMATGFATRDRLELERIRGADYHYIRNYEYLQSSMTTQLAISASGDSISMLVLPNRSLSHSGLWWYLVLQSVATMGFALLAAWGGVVLAPPMAVLELAVVVYCLRRVWHDRGHGQVITLTPSQLEIAATTGGVPPVRFHPYWVRVWLEPARWRNWPTRLLVGSHGRATEIGGFLTDEERLELARRLKELLARSQTPDEMS